MITGFNTDVEYEGVTYHVQTEDKGLNAALILSLVYNRGTILASKRVAYDDLIKENFDENILAARLQKQHKTICAAIRAGRIEDLKQMTVRDAARKSGQKDEENRTAKNGIDTKTAAKDGVREVSAPTPLKASEVNGSEPQSVRKTSSLRPVSQGNVNKIDERTDQIKTQNTSSVRVTPRNPSKTELLGDSEKTKTVQAENESGIPKPKQKIIWKVPVKIFEGELITGNFEIIEEEPIIEAVQILPAFGKPEVPKSDKLQVEFISETVFKGGDRKTVSVVVHRGSSENGIGDAQVMVKVLGSSFRPLIFHAKTDSNGVATIHLQLPHFRSGRAAILVRAMSGSEEAELRRVVAHG